MDKLFFLGEKYIFQEIYVKIKKSRVPVMKLLIFHSLKLAKSLQ